METASPAAGAVSADHFSNDDLNENLAALFSDEWNLEIPSELGEPVWAFQNLTGIYVSLTCPALLPYLRFDFIGLQSLIKRFHRDAFGVKKLGLDFDRMVQQQQLSEYAKTELIKKLPTIGIRINTQSPRKTKIAAAFSLWMSALKPVYLTGTAMQGVPREHLDTFCSSLNFWIAVSYLSMFGKVDVDSDSDSPIRLARIRYDFSYRNVNLSSLEMLYASIFRKRTEAAA